MTIIEVKHLVKKFKHFTAVDDLSFKVDKGEIFAFLGPNGAGKTTTVKMLTTILKPTSGDIKINHYNIKSDVIKIRKSFGIIFQDPTLEDELTAMENMKLHAYMYNMKKDDIYKLSKKFLEFVDLWDKKDIFVRNFSVGMKRRLEVARSFMHEPKILFLDEPTAGLDVQTRNYIWKYLKEIKEENQVTIFFTTHYLEEAEKYADKIVIIDHGKLIIEGTLSSIKNRTKTKTLEEAFLKLTGRHIRDENEDAEMSHIKRRSFIYK